MLSPPRRRPSALAWALVLLLLLAALLPAPAAAQEPAPEAAQEPAPAPDAEAARAAAQRAEAERVEAERVEAERVEAERVEAERVEAERVEAERTIDLRNALTAAAEELAVADATVIGALSRRNRAAGDLVVARLDLVEAQERVVDTGRRVGRAERALERATRDLEESTVALGIEAAAAYRAGSTSQTAPMIAMEAVVRSRNPREFVDGLGYLRQMLPGRLQQRVQAEQDQQRAGHDQRASRRALQRAESDVVSAEEALRAAEAAAPPAQARFAEALADHAARTERIIRDADSQSAATQQAPPTPSTAENMRLAADLVALARTSAVAVRRLRDGSARIEAGKEGVVPWRDVRCPVDGPTQFVNDWGFPRTGGRSHEGTDVFATRGTPVVAMADGVVQRVSHVDAGLGGRSVTYEVDGYRIYNAHLDTVADLQEGDALPSGAVIGTVGTTGNARGTPPHNHLGLYHPEGAPLNPYPLLRRACR